MSKKINTSLLDIAAGLIALVIINLFSRYIYFDYISCAILTANIFLIIGIIRNRKRLIPLYLRVFFINLFTIISLWLTPLPITLFFPIPLIAIIFTSIGLYVRLKWTHETKIKYSLVLFFSLIVITMTLVLFYPRYISDYHTVQFNRSAVEFEFVSFEGNLIQSSDLKGNVIILDFWESSCGPCIASMPALEKLYQKYKNNQSVKMLCVNVGWQPLEKEKSFTKKRDYVLPLAYDEKSRNEELLGFGGAGFLIIIDKQFNIRLQHLGYDHSEDFVGSLSRHIEHYLAEN